jgi:hypothetical protein
LLVPAARDLGAAAPSDQPERPSGLPADVEDLRIDSPTTVLEPAQQSLGEVS